MGDQPPPKLTEDGVIEAGIGQLQAEQVFPIDATAHGTPKNCGSSGCLSCFLTPRISVECRIPATESGAQVLVEDPRMDLQQQVGSAWTPGHLLLLHHPLADHLIHGRFHECRGDGLTIR